VKGKLAVLTLAVVATIAANHAVAQTNSYTQTNLVSDLPGMAAHTDPKLVNPWGISFLPGQPFWIADNNSGFSTLYDSQGNSQQPTVTIPPPQGAAGPATPTGTVSNATSGFVVGSGPSLFIFDTEDGTISGWNGTGTNAILAVDRSKIGAGAVYKGLALITSNNSNFLLATNFRSGQVEVFNDHFQLTNLQGSFTDPNLPAGFAPFGIQPIGNQIFVTYAMQDSAKHDPVAGAGNGFVSIFDMNGNFVKRFASNGTLNSPWGVVMAPAGFGAFGRDVLVGNFDDGTINAFNPASGNFLGQLKDSNGQVITNDGLWALVFGAGGTGNPNTLYFTAGISGESHGLFGTLDVGSGGGGGGSDFSFGASPQTKSVVAGLSTTFLLTVTPQNGFSSTVNFSCTAPSGISCSFNPASVTPTNNAATTTMTLATTSAPGNRYRSVFGMNGMWIMSGLGLLGTVFVGSKKRRTGTKGSVLAAAAVVTLTFATFFAVGCGGGSMNATQRGTANIMVTATSGTTVHTTNVSLSVM
jgi:uncharacterized protein (TIGR03118 family)